jgi:hypothetical protein
MRARILARAAVGLALACGSGSNDGSGRGAPTQTNLSIATTGNGLVRGAGTDCRGACKIQVTAGLPMHLVAVPDAGAFFAGWSGACSGSGACDLTMDVDRTVSATFGDTPPPPPPGKHQLAVVIQGSGRVTSSPPGIDCGSGTCNVAFDSGTSVTLTATAASGFSFSGWGNDCSGPSACTVTLSKDVTVFASFVAQPSPPPAQVHLFASVTGSGTVSGGGLNCGESAATCDVMVASGATITLTASAAAATRFMGWGEACSGTSGTCQLTLQSDTRVTAEFQPEVLVLAPNDGTNGTVIAINSTHLFWPRFKANGTITEIWSVPKKGGAAVAVASFSPVGAMVADDAFLYWTEGTFIWSTPVGGGPVSTIARTGGKKLVLDEVGALYWTTARTLSGSGQVHKMQDRVETILATVPGPTGGVAVDGTHVYFTHFQNDTNEGTIQRVPRNGGPVEMLVSCGKGCFPLVVRVDSQFVYFRAATDPDTSSGHVQVWSKADRSLRVISRGNGIGHSDGASLRDWDVDANGFLAYWNWTVRDIPGPFGIFRANADGSGFGALDSDQRAFWRALRVDDVAVYYEHDGAIIRRLK